MAGWGGLLDEGARLVGPGGQLQRGPQAKVWCGRGCSSQASLRRPGLCPGSATSFLHSLRRGIISPA